MSQLLQLLANTKWAMERVVLFNMAEIFLRHQAGQRLEESAIAAVTHEANHGMDEGDGELRIVDGVAIVPIVGVISKGAKGVSRISQPRGTTTGEIQKDIRFALDNHKITSMALDIDSPGGNTADVDATARFIRRAREIKPIVAFISDTGASAAYWLASQANVIIADPAAHVGSIGIYSVLVDSSKLHADKGISVDVVGSGKYKGVGEPGTVVTDEQRAFVQRSVDQIAEIFINTVATGRGMSVEAVKAIADGDLFIGQEAVQNGLVDYLGESSDAIDMALELVKKKAGKRATGVATSAPLDRSRAMDKDENVKADGAVVMETEPVINTNVALATAKLERARQGEIRALGQTFGMDAAWVDAHCNSDVTVDSVKSELLERAAQEKAAPVVSIGEDLNKSSLAVAMEHAICQRASIAVDKPHERANQFKAMSLMEMARAHCTHHGVATDGMARESLARFMFKRGEALPDIMGAGGGVYTHSTSDFPLILANVVNKKLLRAFEEAPATWRAWASIGSAPDFKQLSAQRFGEFANLLKVEEGESYTESTVGESQEVWKLGKYGRMFSLTWETLINDDLGAFNRLGRLMGAASARLVNVTAYSPITTGANGEIMGDGVALFDAAHNNLAAAPGAISEASLDTAFTAMRTQKGVGPDVTIDIRPKFLLVPVAKAISTKKFISSSVDPTANNATPNPFQDSVEVISDGELDKKSATAWHLLGDPAQHETVEVTFLDGQQAPVITSEDGFDVDGRRFKVRMVVAAKATDWRAMYKNAG